MENEKHKTSFVVKAVSLRPIDWATIDAHAKHSGVMSRSAGLRMILTEWAELKAAPKTVMPDTANLPELLGVLRKVIDPVDFETTMAEWRRTVTTPRESGA